MLTKLTKVCSSIMFYPLFPALLSGGEESSEDELYERQASIRLKSMHRYGHHRHVIPNGHVNNNSRQNNGHTSPVLSAAESPF